MTKPCEFPCLNPNHSNAADDDAELMRNVIKAWIDGNEVVRVQCPDCRKHDEPGFRDKYRPRAEVMAMMIDAYSVKEAKAHE